MSRGTVPIITCDHEDGCDQWTVDYYSLPVTNWPSLMPGWLYDPYGYDEITKPALCPDHAPEGER